MTVPKPVPGGLYSQDPSGQPETKVRTPIIEPSRAPDNSPPGAQGASRSADLAVGGLRAFPYADLIREHLAHGRILAAQDLLDFARSSIPSDSKLVKALAPPRIRQIDTRDVDRSPEYRWIQTNSAKFQGQWVALLGEQLVASAATLAELLSALRASPPPGKPLIHHLD